MTSKEKLDNLLGISQDQSMDDFLNDLDVDLSSTQQVMDNIDSEVKTAIMNVDNGMTQLSCGGSMDLANIQDNLQNISELINVSKHIIKHLYDNIINTDLIDTELVNAAASFIEVAHRNTKEYIDLYKDRLRFFDRVRLEMLQQQNKLQILEKKHQYEMEKLNSRSVDVIPEGSVSFDQERIVDMLDEIDKQKM